MCSLCKGRFSAISPNTAAMILLIDNYDSFVFNLARYFERLGVETVVVRNDAVDAAGVRQLRPAAVVLSPGPCTPDEAGNSLAIVRELHAEVPMLGVCLGHQTIAAALGGQVVRAATPMHGRASLISHHGTGLFNGVPSPFTVGRYHSLVAPETELPAELRVTAWTEEGTVMALEHERHPVYGVQFHPESILTEHGYAILANFLKAAGQARGPCSNALPEGELATPPQDVERLPDRPVTF